MKTTLAGCLLAVTMLAGLLTASFAITQKEDQGEELMQVSPQRQLVEGSIKPYAKALLNIGQCRERLGNAEEREAYERLLRDYAGPSDQIAEARTRLAVPGQPTGRSNGCTIVVALDSAAEGAVRDLKTLRLVKPQIVSGVTDLGKPSWLYCKLHPRWCKNF